MEFAMSSVGVRKRFQKMIKPCPEDMLKRIQSPIMIIRKSPIRDTFNYLKRGCFEIWNNKCLLLLLALMVTSIVLAKYSNSQKDVFDGYEAPQSSIEELVLLREVDEDDRPGSAKDHQPKQASIFNVNVRVGRWDNQRLYRIFDNVFVGQRFSNLSNRYNISLATQSSIDKLDSLREVVEHWPGPISLAVYVADDDEFALLQGFITFLQRCYDVITSKVALHILIPKSVTITPTTVPLEPRYHTDHYPCLNKPEKLLKELLRKHHHLKNPPPYPQNHLRNVARKNTQTYYTFMTDVDIIPSFGMLDQLDIFFKKKNEGKCDKCVYVIPTFELDHSVSYPKTKSELLGLYKKKMAQPFHHRVFIQNQYATNIARWKKSDNDEEIHVSHEVPDFKFFYEPFYVSADTVPPHDERFIGYGYTRNTQVYETLKAGYTFKVLSPVFACHWGLLTKRQRPHWRDAQSIVNSRLMDSFKREVHAKYYRPKKAPKVTEKIDIVSTKLNTKDTQEVTKGEGEEKGKEEEEEEQQQQEKEEEEEEEVEEKQEEDEKEEKQEEDEKEEKQEEDEKEEEEEEDEEEEKEEEKQEEDEEEEKQEEVEKEEEEKEKQEEVEKEEKEKEEKEKVEEEEEEQEAEEDEKEE